MNVKLERKRFHYFMDGCEHFDFAPGANQPLILAWMHPNYIHRDIALIKWCATAEVGTMFEHRMGTVVRLKNHAQGDGE